MHGDSYCYHYSQHFAFGHCDALSYYLWSKQWQYLCHYEFTFSYIQLVARNPRKPPKSGQPLARHLYRYGHRRWMQRYGHHSHQPEQYAHSFGNSNRYYLWSKQWQYCRDNQFDTSRFYLVSGDTRQSAKSDKPVTRHLYRNGHRRDLYRHRNCYRCPQHSAGSQCRTYTH